MKRVENYLSEKGVRDIVESFNVAGAIFNDLKH
jgi:hypothetical protein